MKALINFVFLFYFFAGNSIAQDTIVKLYNPSADGKAQITNAIQQADSMGKHVFVQVGGNWCKWCIRFNKFCNNDVEIDTLLQNNFVVVHLNYSPENKNLDILKTFDFPQRFGFPVIVILDANGHRIHTQDTALLEAGDRYDKKKVTSFLSSWTRKVLDSKLYEK